MSMNVESSVRERYSEGAHERQESLCCPVDYDAGLLEMLPGEIIEKDYGCGDPSRYVHDGDIVLDLGSGGGKICYMSAQLVGAAGHVIGIDTNDHMLALARGYQSEMAEKLGNDRVSFRKGNIQDLGLDLEALEDYLKNTPVNSTHDYAVLKEWEAQQRQEHPLVGDESVDLVISNCVLNLVADHEKQQLVREIFRVLKPGGRVAISDIVSDKDIPDAMKNNPELWSGCISGAFQEAGFLDAFVDAGFHAASYDKWDIDPWRVIEGIEFRSVTLTAFKPVPGCNGKGDDEIIYRGPFAEVSDDAGNQYSRGQRVTVSPEVRALLLNGAYADAFIDPAANSNTGNSGCCAPVDDNPRTVTQAKTGNGGGCC